MVSHSIFVLSPLKISRLTFTLRPLPVLPAQLPSLDPSSWLNDGNSIGLPNQNSLCLKTEIHQRCLFIIIGHLVSYAIFYLYPHIENKHSSTQSCNYSQCLFSPPLWKHLPPSLTSTLQCCALLLGSSLYLLFLRGILALVLYSMMTSAMAQWHSWMVLTIISTRAFLLTQLTGMAKWNPTSLVSPRGSPSLNNCHPKNKITSTGARTTASVICSSRSSWNMLAINKPVHAWESGGWLPSPSPKVTLNGSNSIPIFMCWVTLLMLRS